jgi:septal ring factor EnvC (AmiA/AmiB activator)
MSIADWVHGLEGRVSNLETWAGPGQIDVLIEGQQAIRADVARLQTTVDKHGRMLARLTRNVSGLKAEVAGLKTDVAVLKTDVAGLKADVAVLKADVAVLKGDMVEVKGTLAEILRRLPEAPVAG